jgi:hypothetical protein
MRSRSLRAALVLLCFGWAAQADPSADPKSGAEPDAATRSVDLDSLLRLPPSSGPAPEARAGGATRQEWEQRFATARGDVEAAQKAIDKAQQELEQKARGSDNWQMSAPGAPAGSETSPMSYRLRQELRRQRDELASAERRLSDLEVEAKLAGVPDEWTQPPAAPPKPPAPPQ